MGRDKQTRRPAWKVALLAVAIAVTAAGIFTANEFRNTQAQEPPGNHQVAENTAAGSAIDTPLNASAPNGSVSYSLSGNDAANFNINPQTGEISLAAGISPDYETKRSYSLTVTATTQVVIDVTNVDEPGQVELSNHSPSAGDTITASLSDPDGAATNVAWAWARSDGNNWNAISGAAGASYTTTTDDIAHRLQATASYDDPAGSSHTAQAATTNEVRNDPPEFTSQQQVREVAENATAGATVGQPVAATDPNGNTISYAISANDHFSVDDGDGQIRVADGANLDYEYENSHHVTITATDSHGDSADASVTIRVINVDEPGSVALTHDALRIGTVVAAAIEDPDGHVANETWQWTNEHGAISGASSSSYTAVSDDVGQTLTASVQYEDGHDAGKSAEASTASQVGNDAPSFASATMSRTIDENQPASAAVGAAVTTATDPNGDDVTYSLSGDEAFELGADGVIRTTATLDHEAQASHSVQIEATDQHGATATATVSIGVNNLDEAGAVAIDNGTPKVGDTIAATLSDPDGAASGEAWQWARGLAGNWIGIQSATSNHYTVVGDDIGKLLRASVQYTDPQGSGKSTSAQTTDAVANDPPAFTTASPAAASVAENVPVGTHVGEALVAGDPNNDEISFSLSGNGAEAFSVDANGQISTAAALDHEAQASYSLTAHVTDTAGSSDNLELNISVQNVEEDATVSFDTTSQPEVNTTVTATLTDPDGSVSGTTWQWYTADSAAGPWTTISDANSESYTPVDDDVDQYLKVTVSYQDGHGAGTDAAHAVMAQPVAPEPNEPPAFEEAATTFNISINVVEGIRVAPPFRATDPNGDTLTYSIVSDTADAFTIDTATGEVLMGSVVLGEDSTHTATISVSDSLDVDHNADDSVDDSLSLTMTMVNPNIEVAPSDVRTFPTGLWRNDDVIVVANQDATSPMVLIYDTNSGNELENRSFSLTTAYAVPKGVWSDGETVFVTDDRRSRKDWVRAYSLSTGARQSSKDFKLGNAQTNPTGLWADADNFYIGDTADRKLYAYARSDGSRHADEDITLQDADMIITDFWSDGNTVWIAGWRQSFIKAFSMTTGERMPDLDVQVAASNRGPTGLDSDGFNLWAMDQVNDTIYGYVLPQ